MLFYHVLVEENKILLALHAISFAEFEKRISIDEKELLKVQMLDNSQFDASILSKLNPREVRRIKIYHFRLTYTL